ncbi:protein phosphatase 2C domain-containing protein [Micromonospora sp. BRA006-A]|nr:protein phosphatase 2C domain-containing protein [Micromonospora sp. BRA006-A]
MLHVDPELPFAVVCDGMGDGEGSRVAGTTAARTFTEQVHAGWPAVGAAPLRAAVAETQRRVRQAGAAQPGLTGCTLTALVVEPDGEQGWLVQLGDSRAYRLRDGLLELVTVDHTMAWLGLLHGWWPADSPEAARARYQLLRYVGHPDRPEPDLLAVPLRRGDTWLLCTDGISDQLGYHRLRDLLAARRPGAHRRGPARRQPGRGRRGQRHSRRATRPPGAARPALTASSADPPGAPCSRDYGE